MLTDDNYVRSMFSRYYQDRMFPRIEMEAMLLRSPEDILKSLILPENYVGAIIPALMHRIPSELYL